jgi:sigma-B regulation protein RsbU (phosphoserine phosphatase)
MFDSVPNTVTPDTSYAMEQQIARLQALLEASRQVHSTIRVDEVLGHAVRIVVRELEMEGAVVVGPVVEEPVMYGDVPEPAWGDCIRLPLVSRDQTVLAELLVLPPAGYELSIYEQDFLEGLALQTAVALENAALHERDLEWARVQQDLDAARSIQRSLLPEAMPVIEGFSIAGRSSTCYEVGGDYLDTIRLADGSQLLVVADVAGKGLASAIVATSFRASLRSLATQPIPLAELASRVGQQHWLEGTEARRRYVTAIFLRLDRAAGVAEVVNAGHNPGILVIPGVGTRLIEASGTPLGMLPGMEYQAETVALVPGTRILLYTDGLTEVFQGEDEFGSERLVASVEALRSDDAEVCLDQLWAELMEFCSNGPQTDDMTALALCHRAGYEEEIAAL